MHKQERHAVIQEILEQAEGSTHEDIRFLLGKQGIVASQSTLSRDLRELGAVKTHIDGVSVYRLPVAGPVNSYGRDISMAVREYMLEAEGIANFLVIKTRPGNARDFCLVFDRQEWREVVGTLAGDDTVLAICRNPADVEKLIPRLR